jgi:hypothetical protein
MKILKRIDKALPYWVEHILIGWLIQLAVLLITGSLLFGAIVGASFYFFRELYQWFIQGKTHNGKYDHVGWIAPFLGCFFVYALFFYFFVN